MGLEVGGGDGAEYPRLNAAYSQLDKLEVRDGRPMAALTCPTWGLHINTFYCEFPFLELLLS